jgi:mRNA interferase RelE/StbE
MKTSRRFRRTFKRRIATAIETRLTDAPELCGAPLRKTLKGHWKLRVGDYRVVYKMNGDEVVILGIRNRRAVYEDILRRISPTNL